METIKVDLFGRQYQLGIVKGKYTNNGTLYLGLYDVINDEPFSDITVNLPESYARGSIQYINTNDFPQLEDIINEYSLGYLMGSGSSGWCTYPLYYFDTRKIDKYIYREI